MTDDLPFTLPETNPKPGEFVWALEKDVKWVVCEIHDHGADGFEVRMAHNDDYSASRRFIARAQVLAHADAIRGLLEGAGFRLVAATA